MYIQYFSVKNHRMKKPKCNRITNKRCRTIVPTVLLLVADACDVYLPGNKVVEIGA